MTGEGPDHQPRGPLILACGWAGAGNVGDELLTEWVVKEIESAGGQAAVSSVDPAATRRRHPTAIALRWGFRDLRLAGRTVDGVIVGPGGIIQDSSSLWSLPAHLAKGWRASRSGSAIAGVGLGAEPLRRRSSRWLVRKVLGAAGAVVTRDEPSRDVMTATGVDSVAAVDVVFGLSVPALSSGSGDEIVVAVGPATRPGRILPARRRLVEVPKDEVAAAVISIAGRAGSSIALAAFRGPRDEAEALELSKRLGDGVRLIGEDSGQIRSVVAGARAVVTSRYHAAVLAIASGVPTLVVSEQRKLLELVAQVGDPRRVVAMSSWAGAAGWEPPERHAQGLVPGSLEPARQAIADLVAVARG